MTSVLSAISGQFSKSLMLGSFLPASVFTVLALIFVQPLAPDEWRPLEELDALSTQDLVVISFATVLLTGLLYNLNIPIIRLFEGYPWADGIIGRALIERRQREFEHLEARWQGMRALVRVLPKGGQERSDVTDERRHIGLQLYGEYPRGAALILPTRLGNVVRAFEDYPRDQYDMDAIFIWPLLVPLLGESEAAAIDDARTSVDFMLNSSVLLATLALVIAAAGLIAPFPLATRGSVPWQWVLEIVAFGWLAYLAYLGAIGRAAAWGGTVKATFDRHRQDLLAALGHAPWPATRQTERWLWRNISHQLMYGEPPAGPATRYSTATFARGEPENVVLELARGVALSGTRGALTVVLTVRNVDAREATNVIVADTVPDGFDLQLNSVTCQRPPARPTDETIRVAGANPYHFEIGTLGPEDQARLTYRAIPRTAS